MSIALDLSSNYLTGELPVAVENLKHLGEFYVSQNRLSGWLPNSLGKCASLEYLYMDGNLFGGPIPSSLSSLRRLVELDVSENNLSGGIPKFLVTFGELKYLNLSFNDFEGVVQSEGVFKNASATFVEGNNKLCGGNPAKKKKQQPTTTCVENSLLQLSYQSIRRATNGFSTQNLVGFGSFGVVYKGIHEESGAVIAIKVLNLLNRGASRSFLAECEALKNTRHRNLVKVLTAVSGFDYQGNDFKALVYEFMEKGSLEDWLHPSVDMNEQETVRNLNFFQRVTVAIDVAHALEYLHHRCETPIIHCDLKPSNILLHEEMVADISDFGLAKLLSTDRVSYSANQSSSLGFRGTIGYAPPEYGMGSELSTKGDVYSYGILLLEMFTGKRPTDERFKESVSLHNFVKSTLPEQITEIIDPILLQQRVTRGTIANITPNRNILGNGRHLQCLISILKIGLICSSESPSERMDMSDVVTKLCSIRDKLHPTRLHRED
ncbi:receptor kinase-like protein Xa21 [Gossypium arboreum]|uniref:receptor kinase-like protein Xa21 n=1 Tax=Gossypium arboreum TaxID=29729 RepID=UPI0008195FA6|nr:receptor kinase-like protein Xa21 [Gossypium arboreum]